MGFISKYIERRNRIESSELGMCPHCYKNILIDDVEDAVHCKNCGITFERTLALQTYETYCTDAMAAIESEQKGILKKRRRSKQLQEFKDHEEAVLRNMKSSRKTKLLLRTFGLPLLILLVILTAIGCILTSNIGSDVTRQPVATAEVDIAPTPTPTPTSEPDVEQTKVPEQLPEDSTFEVYFLDVGQGDAAVVLCDGKAMLIDGGNNKQSSLIYSFLQSHEIKHLDYIVASHADADHVGGLSGALNYATVGKALCTTTQRDTKTFQNFVKYLAKQNVQITVPDAGDTYSLGNAKFTVLYPEAGTTQSDNTSLVIRVTYGDTSFLFTGDSETPDEKALMNANSDIKTTVLKVAHHGSNSSSCYQFIYEVEPEYAVISVGGSNSYGHPTDSVLSRLRDADVKTYRTDIHGDIHCKSDGKAVKFDTEKSPNADVFAIAGGYDDWKAAQSPKQTTAPTAQGTTSGNEGSNGGSVDRTTPSIATQGTCWIPQSGSKYHSNPNCSNMKNPTEVTIEQAISWGYTACKRCH